MSANEWAIAIQRVIQKKVDKVPAKWKTSATLQKEWNLSEAQTRRRIKILNENKMLLEKKFIIKTAQRTYPVTHYKLIK